MKLEIVSHCWRYSRLLTYQLSSLVLYPPESVQVTMTVFLTEEDEATSKVAQFFEQLSKPPNVTVRRWFLPRPRLMRRAIGRNLAALSTTADWVWFTDCDYFFGSGTLDAVETKVVSLDAPLVFPRHVLIHRTHQLGDQAIERANGPPRVLNVDETAFCPAKVRRAIGGVQIARGDVVRSTGYCKHIARFQAPADHWQGCREDIHFRRQLGTPGTPIDLPAVFRIRHSKCGRMERELHL